MNDLNHLLDVQRHDTLADQLRHRRAVLPERAALVEATEQLAASERSLATVSSTRAALGSEQDRLEGDITHARDRIKAVDAAMYGGGVTNARELQALQDEIASLNRRIGLLEDEEIGIMEQLEPIDTSVAHERAEIERLTAEIERLGTAITTGEAEIDVELDATQAERDALATGVPADLLAEYEQIRSQSGGVAVAELVAGQCGGCHMRLSSMELDRVKKQPVDAIVHCEECGRLLVR